ncbi:hypothetical protein [Pusillimonas noertemannii]|uniref:Uncharacterized protein n=1 Tax=Pusillimonas noertemannii TaxID=305977 RepID=A0A2U1CMM5_9BURK|nr:hypothetical protein [Pusillimonas noertemannii]NYT68742.1 hypothetical protein [Pusillimonas noertemannii]PVY62238.1 hypothetical protein C7440_1731 [Pusillimonas noertemannii]TFL10783.1 hypothetical protein CSC72_09715 [Pusillimonas noertemannii]
MEQTTKAALVAPDCYSLNGEDYHHGGIGDALDSMASDEGGLVVGRVYWLAVSKSPKPSSFFNVDTLLEDIQCRACDEGGEYAEDFLTDLPDEKAEELRALVSNWLDANVTVGFFTVTNATEQTVTPEDIKEMECANGK